MAPGRAGFALTLLVSVGFATAQAPAEPGGAPSRSGNVAPGAEAAAPDKWRYTFFNPTPPELMREFQTDRPDLTEGPFTVDAGHWQFEMDVALYALDRRSTDSGQKQFQSLVLLDPTVKMGVLNNVDLELIATPIEWQRGERRGAPNNEDWGTGDTLLRAKWNLWGNDEGATAVGLLPYVKLPTSQHGFGNRFVEGGLIVPFAWKLPHDFELDAMTEFDVFHNAGGGYHLEWVNSVALHRDLIKDKLNGYVEFYSSVSREPHAGPLESANVGLLYLVAPNVQLDCGINFGLTRRATDYNPFVGLSFRI
jgi:hypothetical protein